MNRMRHILALVVVLAYNRMAPAADTNNVDTNGLPAWLTRPLSLADALDTALQSNANILEAQKDLTSTQGLVIQTRAVALPHLASASQYQYTQPDAIENFPTFQQANRNWNADVQLVQNVYMGGQLIAAIKAAEVIKRQSLADYRTALGDALLTVRVAYYDVLLAEQQIIVREASVNLLQKEVEDQQHRLDAGTVPKFNVLQAEVALANERPNLIQARNNYRIAKNNLANVLGYNLPRDLWEDIPFNLTDGFNTAKFEVKLPDAIQDALNRRTELVAARENVNLQKLNVVNARAGYQPTISLFGGYDWANARFTEPLTLGHTIQGWNAGAQMSWNFFDGAATYGRVKQAKAQRDKSIVELADEMRQIELNVRTAYSDMIQAKETLESQIKVQEEAEEALREANARSSAGTGTQLDVLNAETSLTQARTTQVQAEHDYSTALARFQRATGADMAVAVPITPAATNH